MTDRPTPEQIEHLCEVMHDAYEQAAIEAGWETQERSRVPWIDVPEANKATMRASVSAIFTVAGYVIVHPDDVPRRTIVFGHGRFQRAWDEGYNQAVNDIFGDDR